MELWHSASLVTEFPRKSLLTIFLLEDFSDHLSKLAASQAHPAAFKPLEEVRVGSPGYMTVVAA
jgi:hypothetical protein